MSERSENAPALAGWAQNPNAPVDQRLGAAAQALDFYVDTHDRLEALLGYCEGESAKYPEDVILNPGDAYRDVVTRLRAILEDRRETV